MPKCVATPSRKGMKLKTLPVSEKLKILDQMEAGASMQMVCEEFDIKKSTFCDIKKAKEKLHQFASCHDDPNSDGSSGPVSDLATKRIRSLKFSDRVQNSIFGNFTRAFMNLGLALLVSNRSLSSKVKFMIPLSQCHVGHRQ